ncbi:hypothetical protein EST55_10690 [Idiomarina sp. 29L]|uniref:hypothetical protein n=1 Tax=Idiomarina sp. 29L TaxID=2508877 RepID=UPI001013BF49|nr:hypothetical protein [Idiomarina sp. 29L]RXS42150.1 hypothetical protein EST55_10690 [Idiomarina sp. 29L]
MNAQWTSQQMQALAAMNIPLWEKAPEPKGQYFYKLGSYHLVGETQLPVELPQWFNDFCLCVGERPVAVKITELSDNCLNYDTWFDNLPTADFKKALWQRLNHA